MAGQNPNFYSNCLLDWCYLGGETTLDTFDSSVVSSPIKPPRYRQTCASFCFELACARGVQHGDSVRQLAAVQRRPPHRRRLADVDLHGRGGVPLLRRAHGLLQEPVEPSGPSCRGGGRVGTASPRTKNLDFRRVDTNRLLIFEGWNS